MAVLAVIGVVCLLVAGTGTGAERNGDAPVELAYRGGDERRADSATTAADRGQPIPVTPAAAPSGAFYRRCIVDYRGLDWTADAATVVAAHAAASTPPCVEQPWYRETAFQNGILTFMVLVGEQELAAAAPRSDGPRDLDVSLRAQGFDRIAIIEIASSGPCRHGEIQAALMTLTEDVPEPPGLEPLLASAEAAGAAVDRRESVTVVTGGGTPCATAIVHAGDVLGWITAADGPAIDEALAQIRLP